DLQQRLLGVKVGGDEEPEEDAAPKAADRPDTVTVYTVRRASDGVETAPAPEAEPSAERAVRGFTRWNAVDPRSAPRDRLIDGRADPGAPVPTLDEAAAALAENRPARPAGGVPVAAPLGGGAAPPA